MNIYPDDIYVPEPESRNASFYFHIVLKGKVAAEEKEEMEREGGKEGDRTYRQKHKLSNNPDC